MNHAGPTPEPTFVKVTPNTDPRYRVKIPWTTDSGILKTLLAEKHYRAIKKVNLETMLRETKVRFKPYSSDDYCNFGKKEKI